MKNQVKQLRVAAGLTQSQLAEAVGVSPRTIISLEKGIYKPSIMLAYKISLLFQKSIEEIFQLAANYQEELSNEED
ncbi:helix-turn-helix transcriptional regulator [Enterococcus nangangensis]